MKFRENAKGKFGKTLHMDRKVSPEVESEISQKMLLRRKKMMITSNYWDRKHRSARYRPLKSYAASVFRESSIGMVSTIASTHNKTIKILKSLILTLCLIGFLYQCITFLKIVFQYPTSVHLDVRRPKKFDVPAFSFCNSNGIKRSVYCATYPDHCTEGNDTFCAAYHPYCGRHKDKVPMKQYLNIEHSMTYEEMLAIGDDLDDFLRENKNPFNEEPTGPFLRSKDLEYGGMFCYSLHSVVNTDMSPRQIKKPIFVKPINQLTFYVEDDEVFTPGSKPGILFTIHSPYEEVNPFEDGIFMKPGRIYKIYIEMVNEVLLQEPYETDCTNYTDLWESNNRSGPRLQLMCKQKCLVDTSLKCYGCKMPLLLYPSKQKICTRDEWWNKTCPKWIEEENDKCFRKCKDDCQLTKYTFKVQERHDVKYDSMIKRRRQNNQSVEGDLMENFNRYVFVQIYFKAGEVMTLNHSPKYMTVEIFSAIGGFIGVWLGISLMDIADLFENFYRIAGYFFKNLKKQNR